MKRPWLALTLALAVHVADEALNDFLGFYNPFVMMLRDVLLWQWLPTFEFIPWLSGLIAATVALAALARYSARRWLAWAALPYGLLMALNAVAHIAGSLYTQRLLPGVISAPLLIPPALWLLSTAVRTLRLRASPP